MRPIPLDFGPTSYYRSPRPRRPDIVLPSFTILYKKAVLPRVLPLLHLCSALSASFPWFRHVTASPPTAFLPGFELDNHKRSKRAPWPLANNKGEVETTPRRRYSPSVASTRKRTWSWGSSCRTRGGLRAQARSWSQVCHTPAASRWIRSSKPQMREHHKIAPRVADQSTPSEYFYFIRMMRKRGHLDDASSSYQEDVPRHGVGQRRASRGREKKSSLRPDLPRFCYVSSLACLDGSNAPGR